MKRQFCLRAYNQIMESAGLIVLTMLPNHIQLQSPKFDVKVDFALQNHQTHFWDKNIHKL
jgi:hypothetical protein